MRNENRKEKTQDTERGTAPRISEELITQGAIITAVPQVEKN